MGVARFEGKDGGRNGGGPGQHERLLAGAQCRGGTADGRLKSAEWLPGYSATCCRCTQSSSFRSIQRSRAASAWFASIGTTRWAVA